MGGLLTPRPHCPAPQGPFKEVGADWSELNLGKVKDLQLGRPSRDDGEKAGVSLFWDPKSAHASEGEPSQWGRRGSVHPVGAHLGRRCPLERCGRSPAPLSRSSGSSHLRWRSWGRGAGL